MPQLIWDKGDSYMATQAELLTYKKKILNADLTLHLISAPGFFLYLHFLNLTFSFSLSQEVPLLFWKFIFNKMDK
jgi:hypothetical protein